MENVYFMILRIKSVNSLNVTVYFPFRFYMPRIQISEAAHLKSHYQWVKNINEEQRYTNPYPLAVIG